MTLNTPSPVELGARDIDLRLSVDPVLFTLIDDRLHVLLRRRAWQPFKGWWALPGAINPPGEQLKETMLRELSRIGLGDIWVEQLKTFDRPPQYIDGALARPGRDPRGRVISVAYFGLVPATANQQSTSNNQRLTTNHEQRHPGGIRNNDATWTPVEALPSLAFDHEEIVQYALWRLRNKILYSSVAFQLLPAEFTLSGLQKAYELVLGESLDKRNFRRKVLDSGVVIETGRCTKEGTKRPAKLYHFAQRDFEFR